MTGPIRLQLGLPVRIAAGRSILTSIPIERIGDAPSVVAAVNVGAFGTQAEADEFAEALVDRYGEPDRRRGSTELGKGSRVRMLAGGFGDVDDVETHFEAGEVGTVDRIDLYRGQGVSVTIVMACGVVNVFDDGEHDLFELIGGES